MPLRDHFHPPVKHQLEWDSLHAGWASNIAEALNTRWLPPEFVAKEHRYSEGRLEIDVATYERAHGPVASPAPSKEANGPVGTATATRLYTPPAPTATMPAVFPDTFEVRVFSSDGGNHLVAAIELISPGNKDRPEVRRAFAAKCAAYLQQGISLAIVDIVTARRSNLHNDIVRLMEARDDFQLPIETSLYAVAYRPVLRQDTTQIELWSMPLAIGTTLPTLPLRLTADLFVPLELESTYMETCRKRRLA